MDDHPRYRLALLASAGLLLTSHTQAELVPADLNEIEDSLEFIEQRQTDIFTNNVTRNNILYQLEDELQASNATLTDIYSDLHDVRTYASNIRNQTTTTANNSWAIRNDVEDMASDLSSFAEQFGTNANSHMFYMSDTNNFVRNSFELLQELDYKARDDADDQMLGTRDYYLRRINDALRGSEDADTQRLAQIASAFIGVQQGEAGSYDVTWFKQSILDIAQNIEHMDNTLLLQEFLRFNQQFGTGDQPNSMMFYITDSNNFIRNSYEVQEEILMELEAIRQATEGDGTIDDVTPGNGTSVNPNASYTPLDEVQAEALDDWTPPDFDTSYDLPDNPFVDQTADMPNTKIAFGPMGDLTVDWKAYDESGVRELVWGVLIGLSAWGWGMFVFQSFKVT